jgi:hypothetical protein
VPARTICNIPVVHLPASFRLSEKTADIFIVGRYHIDGTLAFLVLDGVIRAGIEQ